MENKQILAERLQQQKASRMYQCLVCLDRLVSPVSCNTCQKLFCANHIKYLANRCPHCRSQPLQLKQERTLAKILDGIVHNERELQKSNKNKLFKCVVQGCVFEGKYTQILRHRKKAHQNMTIDQIIYQEDYRKYQQKTLALKMMLGTLGKGSVKQVKTIEGSIGEGEVVKTPQDIVKKEMLKHWIQCKHPDCSKLVRSPWGIYIGGDDILNLTKCPRGRLINQAAGWNYLDPRH